MNVYMSAQSYQLDTESNKVMLAINYLTDKIADWIQSYINRKFHSESNKNEKEKMFNNYNKFVNKITAVFELINLKRKTECKLEHFKQKKSILIYTTNFKQIIFILNWNDETYVSLFYQKLKDEIKNKLTKIEWSNDLDKIIKIAVQINNHL